MGSCCSSINEETFLKYERKMLDHSGLTYETYQISNVVIDDYGNYIRTYHLNPNNQKETLILVHGFGGSGVIFWKILKPLSEKFNIYLIDMLGMGGSSRPDF